MVRIFLCAVILSFLPFELDASQKAYISDRLEIPMRAGKGPKAKVIRTLPAGTPVTVLEPDKGAGQVAILLETGEKGWIQRRYLSSEPAARAQLEALLSENKRLNDESAAYKLGLDGSDKAAQRIQVENERLNSELIAIRQASANALEIEMDRNRLSKELATLKAELDVTRRENLALKDASRQDWFLIGAGVLFAGAVLGYVLPRLNWRKRGSWDSF